MGAFYLHDFFLRDCQNSRYFQIVLNSLNVAIHCLSKMQPIFTVWVWTHSFLFVRKVNTENLFCFDLRLSVMKTQLLRQFFCSGAGIFKNEVSLVDFHMRQNLSEFPFLEQNRLLQREDTQNSLEKCLLDVSHSLHWKCNKRGSKKNSKFHRGLRISRRFITSRILNLSFSIQSL